MQFTLRDRVSQIKLPEPVKQLFALFRQWQQEVLVDVVGLEISSAYIKLMKVDYSQTPCVIENSLIEPIPAGLIVKDEIKDYLAVSNLIKKMFEKANITTRYVALAIPRSLAIIKNITIDSRLTAEDMESRAWIEANRLFPELIGNVYLDFSVVGPSEQDANQLDVILVACRKDNIKSYLEVIRQAGLVTKMVDINCYALERALPLLATPDERKETIAMLNMDIDLSTLIVTRNNKLLYAHDQTFDGGRLIAQAAKYLQEANISPDSINEQMLDDAGYKAIFEEILTSHLRHTVHFFYSSRPNISINKIILSGDCAAIPLIASFIQREIGIETQIANIMPKITLVKEIDVNKFKNEMPSLMECLGLAISKLDI